MTKTLSEPYSISAKIDKNNLTQDQKQQIVDIINKTFIDCAKVDVYARLSSRGDDEILTIDVPSHFIANAKMVMYAVLQSLGTGLYWNYEIE